MAAERAPDATDEAAPHDAPESIVARLRACETADRETRRTSHVFEGAPGSGRTTALAGLIANHPEVRPRSAAGPAISVAVVSHACLRVWAAAAADAGSAPVVVERAGDFRRVRALATSPRDALLVICADSAYPRLGDALEGTDWHRVVFDNSEALKLPRFRYPSAASVWYVVRKGSPAPQGRGGTFNCFVAMALMTLPAKPPPVQAAARRPPLDRDAVAVHRDMHEMANVGIAAQLFARGDAELAAQTIACHDNVLLADARDALGERVNDRLAGECPICYEEPLYGQPRFVVPCCGHVFCGECLCKQARQNPACPMCRAPFHVTACTAVTAAPLEPLENLVELARRTVRACLDRRDARVLAVAGGDRLYSVQCLLFNLGFRFVELAGNRAALARRVAQFDAGDALVGVVDGARELPIRLKSVTHVVFFEDAEESAREAWATRATGPRSERLPELITLKNVVDHILSRFV